LSRPNTLFIFGAGASSQFTSTDPRLKTLKSPTNKTFFSTCLQLLSKINHSHSNDDLKILFQYMTESRGLRFDDNYSFLNNVAFNDMEDVITDLDIKTRMFNDDENEYFKSSETLKELIAYVFGKLLGPNVPDKYVELVKLFQPDDLIVIFNYDMILEKALEKIGQFSPSSYMLHPYKIQKDKSWRSLQNNTQLELFKLHGSINWVKCVECNSISVLDEKIFRANIFNCNQKNTIACPRCNTKRGLTRLIIPPVQSKNYDEYPFRYLWRRAERKMSTIGRIASLGYSLPKTDYSARSLFRTLYKYNGNLNNLQLITVNRSFTAQDEYLKMFPEIQDIKNESTIEAFVNAFNNWK
jgi:hypothetical protein